MPKAKTMLDELARVLRTRENAINRFDRRYGNWPEPRLGHSGLEESRQLVDDLSDKAVMEYDRLMRSKPGKRVMQKAWDMMPGDIVREHDYFDR